jgi:hypothetical protein
MPPFGLLLVTLIGIALFVMLGVNAVQLAAHRRDAPEAHQVSVGRRAWLVSVFSLVIPYVAPVSLFLAALDLRRRHSNEPRSHRRPARMAVLNSVWALATLLVVLGVFVGRWTE